MSLLTAVVARVPNQKLVELTRQNSIGSTTYDSTLLTTACDDTEADWLSYAGEAWSESTRRHVVLGVEGVLARLRSWVAGMAADTQTDMEAWADRVRAFAKTSARDRISPESSGPVGTTINGSVYRAPFDHEMFRDVQPEFTSDREGS